MDSRFRGNDARGPTDLEKLFSACENVVQRILKMRRGPGKVASNLVDILLVALLDLVAEQSLESPVAQSLGVASRVVGDNVRHERACKTLCP